MVEYIKVAKDHDDVKVTIQFSGRDEWLTFRQLLAYAFVNSKELTKEYDRFNPNLLSEMFDRVNNLVNELDVGND